MTPGTRRVVLSERVEVRKVREAAFAAASARAEMVAAVRAARAAGVSLRDIAKAAGVSHETARKLTS